MRLLVTGGAGFGGSHYVRGLLGDAWGLPAPESLIVLDKLTYAGTRRNLEDVASDPRLTFVHGDVADAELVERLMGETDAVVHFAAESHVDRSIESGHDFVVTNVVGTQTLLEAAATQGVRRFVQVSTDEVYGSVDQGWVDEDAPLRPSSPYSASKAGADLLALAAHRTHGLSVSVTRATNNYGPRQHPEKLVPRFVTRLLDGRRVPLYGNGLQVRDWLHVDDHARAVHLVLHRGAAGKVYNIAGGKELTNLELTRKLLKACDASPDLVKHVADRPGHDRRYGVDASRIAEELGFRPRVKFKQGLADTVRWYAEHRDWWEPLLAD